jgi:hypothetical protein
VLLRLLLVGSAALQGGKVFPRWVEGLLPFVQQSPQWNDEPNDKDDEEKASTSPGDDP